MEYTEIISVFEKKDNILFQEKNKRDNTNQDLNSHLAYNFAKQEKFSKNWKVYDDKFTLIITADDYLEYIQNIEFEIILLHARDILNLTEYYENSPELKFQFKKTIEEEYPKLNFLFTDSYKNNILIKQIIKIKEELFNKMFEYNNKLKEINNDKKNIFEEMEIFECSKEYLEFVEYVKKKYHVLTNKMRHYIYFYDGNNHDSLLQYYEINKKILEAYNKNNKMLVEFEFIFPQ